MQAESGTRDSYTTYKIKRMAKILVVCAGIVVVSVSLGLITALELVASYHKDPATAKTFSEGLTLILMIGGIGAFMAAVWRVEYKARRSMRAG
jgi:hypothetical protein